MALLREAGREVMSRRLLIRYLVQAQMKKTGADKLLGNLWWIVDPLLQLAVYVLMVQVIFKAAVPDYALFVFASILPWKWFTQAVGDSIGSVTGHDMLIKQVQFPKIVLPHRRRRRRASCTSRSAWSRCSGMILLFYVDRLSPFLLLIPVIAVVQFVFTIAVAFACAAVNVFFRDLGNIIRHFLRIWFYLSPALYGIERLDSVSQDARSASPGSTRGRCCSRLTGRSSTGTPRRGRRGPTGRRSRSCSSSRSCWWPFATLFFKRLEPVIRQGPVIARFRRNDDPGASAGPAHFAIDVRDLGVRYNLRFTRKTTLRQSFYRLSNRETGEKHFWALRDVTCSLTRGESLAVIGPNGAGKSTLLQTLAGIITPSEGVIDVNGHVSTLLTLGAGFDPDLTGRENILLAGAFLGISPQGDAGTAWIRSSSSPTSGSSSTPPIKTYSSGMRARLGFAIATSVDPDILLIDEVLATGDQAFREKSKGRVLELARAAKAIVLVTHDMNWVTEFCNRAMLIEQGHVVAEGRPAEIVELHQEHSRRTRDEQLAAAGPAAAAGPPRLAAS